MSVEFKEWVTDKPDAERVFCVYEPREGYVTMVRVLHSDDLSGDVTWCPHTGKEHFGDMHHDFLWCYAPGPVCIVVTGSIAGGERETTPDAGETEG